MSTTPDTLTAYLRLHAQERPNTLYGRYIFADRPAVELTYQQTEQRTRQFAELYARHNVTKGDVVLVILEHHEDLMPAFLGAMWLGAIPAFLPFLTAKLDPQHYHKNLTMLLETSLPRAIITYRELRDALEATIPRNDNRPALLVHDWVPEHGLYDDPRSKEPEDVAFIQYSSGSTGVQKGAALSHRAVLAEIRGVGEFFELTQEDSFLTWVPLYHDWGLVCAALHALQLGTHFTLLSPLHWVTAPVVAFEAIHKHRPTVYFQPNFAFNYMTKQIRDQEMAGLDLSSLRLCANGAEPCFYDSHQMFADRFVKWGFKRDALAIVYGMAELTNTVFACGHKEPVKVDCINRRILQSEHRAQPLNGSDSNLLRMLGVGRPLRGTEFRILSEDRQELPERKIGEVAIRSRARYHGYHRNSEATEKSDHEGWYLSGDLGYRVDNTLFITGRKSDLIIVGGVNIYPQDVEKVVAEHPAAVAGRVAAIGVDDWELGTQRLIVIVESRSTDSKILRELADHVRNQIPRRLGVSVDQIYHAPYRWLIKTSSGKIARIPNYQRLHELSS